MIKLKTKQLSIALVMMFLAGDHAAFAGKIALSLGVFSYQANSGTTTGSQSGLASYNLAFCQQVFLDSLEFEGAFNLIATGIIGGDLAFGPEIGFNYFPFSDSEAKTIQRDDSTFVIQEHWRPFVGGMFAQRSFRSVAASYAGVGFKAGIEKSLGPSTSLRGVAKYIILAGPSNASATEMTFNFGIGFQF